MSQILNSLVISDGVQVQAALENIMANNIEGYTLSFITCALTRLHEVDRDPDLIFIENVPHMSVEMAQEIIHRFPGRTYVVLAEDPEPIRRRFLKVGVDEVMSMKALESDVGKHLLEKLVALKDLAAAEARVEQSEERFRDIIEHSHDMIALLDHDATILYTSPAFGRQMGYEQWEVLGQTLTDFVQEEDRPSLQQNFRKLLTVSSSEGMSLEFQFRRNDGEWRNIEAIASNLLRNPTVQAIVLNSRDVTDQKQTEIELENYRRHLEDLVTQRTREAEAANRRADTFLAASPDTLIALDAEGHIRFASQHYKLRYPKDAHAFAPGRHILDGFEVMARSIPLSSFDPRYAEMKAWWLDPQGSREFRMSGGMWARLQARRMEDSDEIVISTTDITDYKRQQALLAAQSAELTAALEIERKVVEQQKTFVSMVSHEFRTPLTIIDGNAQIIQNRGDKLPKEMLEKRSNTIRNAVERLVQLIETVLSVHMMESGKLSIETAPCDLATLVRDVVADQQDISPHHKISLDIRPIPQLMQLDEKVIRQTMTNLLSNAVKYSPKSPHIDVRVFEDKGTGEVVMEVADKGVGIPADELPRIFAKYFRASTSGGIPGSGLGLSLVKQFIELHNGTIGLQSVEGAGTVVSVRLPIVV